MWGLQAGSTRCKFEFHTEYVTRNWICYAHWTYRFTADRELRDLRHAQAHNTGQLNLSTVYFHAFKLFSILLHFSLQYDLEYTYFCKLS